MASSAQAHFRSISLPSKLILHPTNFETGLRNLKSNCGTHLNSKTIQSGLLGLAELYNSVEEFINQSPSVNQTTILRNRDVIEESLEGSIQLLDSCSIIRELFQEIKENVQALQSALRRKGLDSSIQNDVARYSSFRKKMRKCIAKSLKKLKNLENKKIIIIPANAENSNFFLSELMGVSIAILKSVLVFLWGPPSAKPRGWNLVISKLMLTKSTADCGRDQNVVNEMDGVDSAINNLNDVQFVRRSLENLDGCIEGLESEIDRLVREMIRCRVAFLNILTHNHHS